MKILRLLLFLLLPAIASAQASTEPSPLRELVKNYLLEKKSDWKLTDTDIESWIFSNQYTNEKNGISYLYIQQQVKGIKIFNAVSSATVKDGKIKSFGKKIYPDAAGKINASTPSNTASFAIEKAAEHLGLKTEGAPKFISSKKSSHRYYFSAPAISKEKIRVDLVYQNINGSLRLAWDVNIHLKDGSHWWNVRIDAVTGDFLQKNDWVTHCDFGDPGSTQTSTTTSPLLHTTHGTVTQPLSVPGYRVFPLPLEAPNFGPSVFLTNPADPVASPFGWHDTNGVTGAEFTIARGNNVYAYDDIADADMPGSSPDGTASLTFDFPTNFTQQPSTYLDASITNLFYINNKVHDLLYHNGFDELSGNFQENNYAHGGIGADYVVAECQDGGGTNNANFSTPDDGQNGRMQMYLWSGAVQAVIVVNSPASIAGNYNAVPAGFGPAIVTAITANLVLVDDGNAPNTDACEPLVNGAALPGKIAVIDRGTCNFVDKVLAAQGAGAVAVLVVNNSPGAPISMGDNGNGASVTIPSEMISQADGLLIKNTITGGGTVNATLNPPPTAAVAIDGSLDNGIVIHEFGHGVSNRLTGGPSNSNCLFNAEQGGEGWSDFFAMIFTMTAGAQGTDARGMATFALGQPSNGYGLRRYPYSTDMTTDPLTYGDIAASPEVHDIGEIWCTVLWEMNWGLINQFGFDPDWINGTSGNNIALKLVMEGMKLQPCGPGFLDARDAILSADDNLYGGVHKCIIWEAFAKRGMGYDAIQGDADIAGDETEDFSLPPSCLIPTSAPTADFDADVTTTCFGIVNFNDMSTDIAQTWHWNFGDGDTSNIQNPTHTYNAAGTYTVKLVVTNILGMDSLIRTNYITITRPPAPTFTGDTTVCGGNTTSLTATVLPGNVAEWRNDADSLLFSGPVFVTPVLTSGTVYHLTQITPTPLQHVGPPDNTFAAGGYHSSNFEGKLLFTTLAPMRLKSVWVDASGAAVRTVKLYSGGTLIQSLDVNIPNGQSRVTLNFDITIPGNYSIGVASGSDLYRNNAGASYPYTISGLVSITASNSTTNPATYYYYLYDWEVQELPCKSSETPINITLDGAISSFAFSANGLAVQFTDNSTGNPVSWAWNFGNNVTSNLQNPSNVYVVAGTYTVTLTVTDANGCQSVTGHVINVNNVGINDVSPESFDVYFSGNELTVKFQNQPENAEIVVYDPIGKVLLNTTYNSGKIFTTQLEDISSEFILVSIKNGDLSHSKKIILIK